MVAILRFALHDRTLGILADHVREVLRAAKPSPLPEAPPLVVGVLNVRGEQIPVYDIRARFGLPARALLATDAIVVAKAGERWAGIVVDRALDLVHSDSIADVIPGACLTSGTALLPDGSLVICDLAHFLSSDEEDALARAFSLA